jgi:MoaA/NifB/PqqE/SkfB family radical SAM enzyme
MSLNTADIKWLHVEASTRCNAWCPACSRNQNGKDLAVNLIEQDLSTARFREILEECQQLDGIQFCGNLGDPVIAHNFLDLLDLCAGKTQKIQIHTNGSLRNTQWWQDLATRLKQFGSHDVWFGIDGLEGVHEIYRQGTDFQKVIRNAQAFIGAGGHATWQFIPFKHNQSQIKECIKLSQSLGFKKFKVKKSFRKHKTISRHWKTGETFMLEPADIYQQYWNIIKKDQVLEDDCMHLSMPSIYVSADGSVSPCCYLSNQLETSSVVQLLKTVDIASSLHKPLSQCLNNCGSCSNNS